MGLHSPTLWCPLEQNRAKAERLWDYIAPKTQEFHALGSNLHDHIVVAVWTTGEKQPPRAFPITALDLRFDAESCGAINDEVCLLRRVAEGQSNIGTGGDFPDLSKRRVSADIDVKFVEIAYRLNESGARPPVFSGRDEKTILGA